MVRRQSRKTVLQETTTKSTKKTSIQTAIIQKKSIKITTSTWVTTTSTIASIAVKSALNASTSASIANHVPLESNSNTYEDAVMMEFANVSLDEPFSIDFTESESEIK